MKSSTLIWFVILGTVFMGMKLGQKAQHDVKKMVEHRESQLEKAMMDLE